MAIHYVEKFGETHYSDGLPVPFWFEGELKDFFDNLGKSGLVQLATTECNPSLQMSESLQTLDCVLGEVALSEVIVGPAFDADGHHDNRTIAAYVQPETD